MSDVKNLPVAAIQLSPTIGLREADLQDAQFLGLVASIKQQGVLKPILVRPCLTAEGKKGYELVDGLQRFTAAQMAGVETIPAHIKSFTDEEAMFAQISANHHKVDTKPAAYAQHLRTIIARNPGLTRGEIANKVGVTPEWIDTRLKLLTLPKEVGQMIDDGKLTLANALELAKLPDATEQVAMLSDALTKPADDFKQAVTARKKALAESKKTGEAPKAREFEPVAKMKNRAEVQAALAQPSAITDFDGSNAIAGAVSVLNWVLGLNATAVAAQKATWDAEQKASADAQAAKAKERADKKLAAAQAEQAKLTPAA